MFFIQYKRVRLEQDNLTVNYLLSVPLVMQKTTPESAQEDLGQVNR